MSETSDRKPLGRHNLPLACPEPCPICGNVVYLAAITEWGTDDGIVSCAEYDCETEPPVEAVAADEWEAWHAGHWSTPYIDWLPWENRMLDWLNRTYRWEDSP